MFVSIKPRIFATHRRLIHKTLDRKSRDIYYKRCVDDIIIIYDQNRINKIAITSVMNGINEQLEFKATEERNNSINYVDLTINRNINKIEWTYTESPLMQISQLNTLQIIHKTTNKPHSLFT